MKWKDIKIFTSPFINHDEIILRDFLALERTRLANERTLMSYVRTALFFLTGGVALLEIKYLNHIRDIGYFSMVLSGFTLGFGIFRYWVLAKRIKKFYPSAQPPNGEPKQTETGSNATSGSPLEKTATREIS
jgi:putative membrane protein